MEELKPYSKKDLLVGCITKYSKSDIEPWVESIQRSGYTGGKMMLVYDVSQDVINYLKLNHILLIPLRISLSHYKFFLYS